MPHRAAALVLVALLAFPGAVMAATQQSTPAPIQGTPRGDDLTGTAGADRINGRGGNDTIRGRAGSDRLNGGRGNDLVFGDSGRDVISGGPGSDTLLGGAGNDRISAGTGADLVAGGSGNDIVRVRDGQADRVTCGPGRDRVVADAQDIVAHDCEAVERG